MAKREPEKVSILPKRIYSEEELKAFHERLQKYYKEKTLKDGSVIRVLDYNEFAVAYGAFVKRPAGGNRFYYLRSAHDGNGLTRFEQMVNLMDQYNWWLGGNPLSTTYQSSPSPQPQLFITPPENAIDNDIF